MTSLSTARVALTELEPPGLTDEEFRLFQRFIYEKAGASLADSRKLLVSSRLAPRLRQRNVGSYGEYFNLIRAGQDPEESQIAIDLLTTHETYFFREPRHFDFLREQLSSLARIDRPVRIWSAAGSSGEEAYSIAMVLEDVLAGRPWELTASDISTHALDKARRGQYPLERARQIPLNYLRRFCLEGYGKDAHTLLIKRDLRNKVQFLQVNLNAPLPPLGSFDFIFLRNVLIYFNLDTRRQVVARVLGALAPGGWLLTSHTETLFEVTRAVEQFAPSVFRKPYA